MWYKILISTIITVFIALAQITLLGSFGPYAASINLLLAIFVIMLFLVDFKWLAYLAIISGLILDIYSSLPFGVFMISYFISISISYFLLFNFFTNRSFYSVIAIGLSALAVYNLIFLIFTGGSYLLGFSNFFIDKSYWLELGYQIINMFILLISLFFIINLFSRKFKPNFIRS